MNIVAKNRPPRFEQKRDSLRQWHDKIAKQYGKAKAQRIVSQLEVRKPMRRYNSLKRAMPSTIFRYQGKRFVLTSLLSKGLYYRTFGQGKKKPSRTVPKPQMSTWLAFASVFLSDNEEPTPTTQAEKHKASLNQLTDTPQQHKPIPCHRLPLQLRQTL